MLEFNCRYTFGVGIVKDENILCNEREVYVPEKGKGIIPREAAESHSENCSKVLKSALEKAKIKINEVDVIAVALGPGLPPCLRVGAAVGRFLSLKYNKPLVAVNHPVLRLTVLLT